MKLPSIPKIPKIQKIPKISMDEIREKLPFQPRREFVMYDSEHPIDAADMEYRPSTGYAVQEQRPVYPPQAYANVDQELPFQQEMVYPGGQTRIPYAAGGQAQTNYSGSWPPPRQPVHPPAAEMPRQEYTPQSNVEFYQPRARVPQPEYARPYYAVQPGYAHPVDYSPQYGYVPRQEYPPQPGYGQPVNYDPRYGYAPRPEQPPRQTARPAKPAVKKGTGFAETLGALAGSLLPRRKPSRLRNDTRQQPSHSAPAPGQPPPFAPTGGAGAPSRRAEVLHMVRLYCRRSRPDGDLVYLRLCRLMAADSKAS